jgi:photosystem II stability/assembly factor-like uncharacterized protein
MRRFFLPLVLVVLVMASFIQAQEYQEWKWLTPKPNGSTIRWVKIWDANNWYILGGQGTFMKTTNAGATWYFHHKACKVDVNGGSQYAYAGYFPNMNNGFVACANALIKTTNGGVTFDTVYTSTASFTLYNLYFLNSNVGYAAGSTKLKTTDAGATWSPVANIASTTTYDMTTPNDTLLIFTSTSGNVIRSTNAGTTFASVSTGASATLYRILMINPTTFVASGSTSAIRLSTDAGTTWASINTGISSGNTFYDLDYVNGKLYVTGNSRYIFTTTNLGATWDSVSFLAPVAQQTLTTTYFTTDIKDDLLLTAGGLGLINSRIGTTNTCYTSLPRLGTINAMYKDKASGRMIATGAPTQAGFYDQFVYSTNSGQTWLPATTTKSAGKSKEVVEVDPNYDPEKTATSTATFQSLSMLNSTTGFACGSKGAIYKTTNGGVSWDSVVTTIPVTATLTKIDFVSPQIGWVFSSGDTTNTIFKTTDGGTTWTPQTLGASVIGTEKKIYGADMIDANYGYCVNYTPVPFKTTDGGATWVEQALSDGWTSGYLNSIKMVDTSYGYCVGGGDRVYRTTNGGTNWDKMTAFSSGLSHYCIDIVDTNNFAIGSSSGITAFTTNGGTSWALHPTNGFGSLYAILYDIPTTGQPKAFTAGMYGAIFERDGITVPVEMSTFTASVNGNSVNLNWSTATETNNSGFEIYRNVNNNLTKIGFIKGNGTSTQRNQYTFTDGNLRNGRYSYQLRQIDFDGSSKVYNLSNEVVIGTPMTYSLSQNYPNPFNPSTVIKYSIPQSSLVTLKVYNILGKEVASLVNENKEAGNYTVNFSAKNLSSGVYFYTIKAGNFTQTKKMTIIK